MNKKLYATGDNQCPVRAFKFYVSKLHPSCPWLYQQPKKITPSTSDSIFWYNNAPLGHNTIGNMMREFSKSAALSKQFTNHSIRATAIRALNNAGTLDRIICSLSGHRNINSIRSYCRDASEQQKRDTSDALSMSRRCPSAPATVFAPPPPGPKSTTAPIPNPTPALIPTQAPAPVATSASVTPQHDPIEIHIDNQQSQAQHPARPLLYQPPMAGEIVRQATGATHHAGADPRMVRIGTGPSF